MQFCVYVFITKALFIIRIIYNRDKDFSPADKQNYKLKIKKVPYLKSKN